jgi:type I restriction enzyme S subunit
MMRMWQGASGLASHDAIVSPAYIVLTPTADVDPLFASYWFKSSRLIYLFWAYSYGITGDRLRLYYKDFARIPVTIPPKPRQVLIGKTLATWDRAIESTRKLVQTKRALKNDVAQQLLLGSRRLRSFKKPWTKRVMTDVALVNPPTPKPRSLEDDVTFLAMADVAEGGGILNHQVRKFHEVDSGFTAFQDGDILVAKITPCFENGKGALLSGLVNGIGFGTTELHVVRPKPEISSEFLYYVTMSRPFRQRGVANMTGSAGQKRVPTGFVRHYHFECPSFDEQKAIAAVLSTADLEVKLLERKLAALETQKKALIQHLLLGNGHNNTPAQNGGKP